MPGCAVLFPSETSAHRPRQSGQQADFFQIRSELAGDSPQWRTRFWLPKKSLSPLLCARLQQTQKFLFSSKTRSLPSAVRPGRPAQQASGSSRLALGSALAVLRQLTVLHICYQQGPLLLGAPYFPSVFLSSTILRQKTTVAAKAKGEAGENTGTTNIASGFPFATGAPVFMSFICDYSQRNP